MARKTKEESEETRKAILLAALDVLSEKGYSRTTFVDIARRIGMSKGAVYWHFKNKQALLAALMEEMRGREEALLAGEAGELTSLDGLKAYLVARMRIATRDDLCRKFAFFMLLQMEWSVDVIEAVRRELMNLRKEPFDEFTSILNEARCRGELRPDIDIATAKDMLKGMWIGPLTVYFQGLSATDPVQTAEIALGILIDSLRVQHS
ncbi:MAG TPA: TetR family transcriptional regulator [Candidatus Hydrogenedentes bacterium]|jgi:AcrR family transcriptional regulator|nr:TetR family transcriptional regulator [Candidatus Hydrogenedentota bacterium]